MSFILLFMKSPKKSGSQQTQEDITLLYDLFSIRDITPKESFRISSDNNFILELDFYIPTTKKAPHDV